MSLRMRARAPTSRDESRTATGQSRWFAPGRVNIIGDHTDYQAGWVLPFAVAEGATVNVEVNDTSRVEVTSTEFGTAPSCAMEELAQGSRGWSAYIDGALVITQDLGIKVGGARISVESDLPSGAGVASSAAVTCATIAAVMQASGQTVEPTDVAVLAQRVENEYLGAGVGYMDPAASMFGRSGYALLIDTRSRTIEPVRCALDEGEVRLLLIDSGVPHATSGAEYAVRVAQCREAASLLGVDALRDISNPDLLTTLGDPVLRARARHVVTENARVLAVADLLRAGRVRDIGTYLTASHASLRDDFDVSTPALELIVNTAMDAGALGARVTGAGFGGAALVLVDNTLTESVRAALSEAFERQGWQPGKIRQVRPSAGARPLAD
ncbi:MAG: galactokinase [Actinomycetes bacterium]